MTAIYKKELRGYFTSMIGYVCIAFMLIVIGIYYTIINLASGYPYFGYTLSCVLVLFLLMTPVLTMRVLAEERNKKTDQMLLTAPLPLWQVVVGKYLAMVSVFGIAMAITCLYPVIMCRFGTVSLVMAYTAILGYFLYGAACIAIGLFISSITESQIVAALLTFFVVLVFYITSVITNSLPSSAMANFVIWACVIFFFGWVAYILTRDLRISVALGGVALIVDIVIYLAKSSLMAGSVAKVVACFDMTTYFTNFGSGVFDVTGIVYYVSIILFCIFLTIQSIERRRWDGDVLMCLVMLAIVVFVNLVVGEIPVQYTQFDLTDNQMYTLTDETKDFVSSLEKDVTIYLVVQSGNEDADVVKVLERYGQLSGHISVQTKDPVVNPTFATQYTSSSLTDNSMIVVCGERYKIIDYSDIYEYELSYYSYSYSVTGFDAEGQITSAIDYVTSEEMPVIYTLTGHSESSFSDTLSSQISKENIDVSSLSLVLNDAVPEDAACVIINSPQTDISEDELNILLTYLQSGGHVIVVTDYVEEEMPNLDTLLDEYGLAKADGLIFEGDSQYYYPGYPAYLIPRIQSTDVVGSMTSDDLVIMPYAQAIRIADDVRSTVEISTFLLTSSKAYIKTDLANLTSTEKESDDETGAFALGVVVTEYYDDVESRLIYLSSSSLLDESMNTAVSGNNYTLFMNLLSYMVDKEESISVASKSLTVEYLTVTAASAGFWGSMAVVVPAALLIVGGVVCFRRRSR